MPPLGKVYLPEGSYREMTEWALPAEQLDRVRAPARTSWSTTAAGTQIEPFVRGGYWRNFKVKYPETNEMYARMMMVSRRLHEASQIERPMRRRGRSLAIESLIDQARTELYRGQCNCSYWHGAFGGIYLPHLRNAVYHHLIAADNLLDAAEGRGLAKPTAAVGRS